METTQPIPWRLDISADEVHGWLLVRAGDEKGRVDGQRAAEEANFEIVGEHTYLVDPQVGHALAYPLASLPSEA